MKKLLACMMCVLLLASLAACSSPSETPADSASPGAPEQSQAAEPQTISFWYYHSGDEAVSIENEIAAYNASQDKYVVEGLSVPDTQKLIVSLGGNESPDVIFYSDYNTKSFQSNGLLESLQSYVDGESYDLSAFSNQALKGVTIDDQLYGLPVICSGIMMYYNKDILESIGYTEPPKTVEEMYEMGVAATTLDGDGNIDILGYPLFPLASAKQELIYAFGGRWWDDEGNLTPDNPGILESLNYNMQYREKYGVEKVQAFVATANTNRYTEQDMFFAGKQLFRLDGSWLATMAQNYGSDVNFGIAPIPAPESNPDLLGVSRYEVTSVSMPVSAPNKEGAWDFMKFFANHDSAKEVVLGTGNLPVRTDLYEDADILAIPAYSEFIQGLQYENGVMYPRNENYSKYMSLIDEYLDYVYNGMKTPEDAMSELAEQVKDLS